MSMAFFGVLENKCFGEDETGWRISRLDLLWIAEGDVYGHKMKRNWIWIHQTLKKNATFIFDTAKYYQRARIVSSMESRGAQQMAYKMERDLHNIDMFQTYFEAWYDDYGKYGHFTMR